ncbi:MAG: hypothetical protein QXR63_01225 [Candidatus Bathyarchaeia archaeon]
MMEILKGFEQMVPCTTKIVYAQGAGIGPKMAHMKNWIESCIKQKLNSNLRGYKQIKLEASRDALFAP